MLGKPDRQQELWDSWLDGRLVPEDHLLVRLDRTVDFGFVAEETKDRVVFRRRLGPARFERLFDRVVEQAVALGLLCGRRKLVDATAIRAAAALRNRAELLRAGRRRVLRELARCSPDRARTLSAAAVAPPQAVSRDGLAAWAEQRTDDLLAALGDVGDEGVASWRDELAKVRRGEGGVASFTDSDCRWGHHRRHEPYLGYKAHASLDQSGIVTPVQVLPANATEGGHLAELLQKDQRKGVRARSVVGDKAYASQGNRHAVRQAGMKPEIPARYRHKQAYRFRYHPRKDPFACPAGNHTVGKSPHRCGRYDGHLDYFSQADGSRCPLRGEGLAAVETRKRVSLSARAREALLSRQRLEPALRDRKQIARKFAEAKCWHGLGRARYRGRWRVAIQGLMTFLVLNLKRMVRLLAARETRAISLGR